MTITAVSDLSCPPRVLLKQPAQSVTLGSQLTLSCHVAGNFKSAYWSRGGSVIRNNSRSQGGGQQFTNGYYDMPEPQYLIRTVLRNDTDLLRGSVNLQAFREEMEDKLTRTYRQAYTKESEPIRRRRDIQFTGGLLSQQFWVIFLKF